MDARKVVGLLLTSTAVALLAWWVLRDEVPLPGAVESSTVVSRPSSALPSSAVVREPSREHAAQALGVRGRLVQGARVVAGATVVACLGSVRQPVELHRAISNEQGVFEQPPIDERYWLAILSDVAPRGWIVFGLEPTSIGQDLGDLEVEQPGRIDGIVRDERGNPVLGAKVTCFAASVMRFGGHPDPLETLSGLDGRFHFDRLHAGSLTCRGVHDRHAVAWVRSVEVVAGSAVSVSLALPDGERVRGVVVDWRGDPLEGAHVRAGKERATVTDALGSFVLDHLGKGQSIEIVAKGHLDQSVAVPGKPGEALRVAMQRAGTLRGVVVDGGGKPGTIEIIGAKPSGSSIPDPAPYSLLDKPLDVVRDGKFEVEGLAMSDYDIWVRVPGVGTAGPMRVELRDDVEVTIQLVLDREVTVVVRDEQGRAVEGAKVLHAEERRDDAARYERYSQELLLRSILRDDLAHLFEGANATVVDAPQGEARLRIGVRDGLMCVVRAPGFGDVARALGPRRITDRIVVTMSAVGSLRGMIADREHSGYARFVEVWPAGEVFLDKSEPWTEMHGLEVDEQGEFFDRKVPPGAYQAAIRRVGFRTARKKSRGVPLIDGGTDLDGVVEFSVVAGKQTRIELPEPRLGVLRGKVLLRGAPMPGAAIVATRVGWEPDDLAKLIGTGDWDEEWVWREANGQLTDKSGSFRMLYRKAGPVELRVRHPEGHATGEPFTIVLPSPGDRDVVRDVHVAVGEIRGRLPVELIAESSDLRVVLFPMRLAAEDACRDPGSFTMPLSYHRVSIELPASGAFRFRYLPAGSYVLRAQSGELADRCVWQRIVTVFDDVVDLGAIESPPRVDARVAFRWTRPPELGERLRVNACWLWQSHDADPQAVWVATLPVGKEFVICTAVAPGRYTAVLGFVASDILRESGWPGPARLSKPVTIEIRSDGSVLPNPAVFFPRASAAPDPATGK